MFHLFLAKCSKASAKRLLPAQRHSWFHLGASMLHARPMRRCFSDDKGDFADKLAAAEEERTDAAEDADFEPNDSTALVSAKVPENIPVLLSVQVGRRPVFPGFYKTVAINDRNVVRALSGLLKRRMPYLGIFMRSGDNDQVDLVRNLSEVHKIGVMAQLITLTGPSLDSALAVVLPHRRIRALDMVGGAEELVAKLRVENVADEPYDRQDSVIRAVCQEIYVTLAEMVKISPFFREHLGQRNMPSAVFEDPARLADFVAVLCTGQPQELQDILETPNIAERLQKALVLLKKEQIHAQLQNKIREDVETKVNLRQREYFLHEQLKSIKKELGIETDTKEKLTQLFSERATGLKMPEAVKRIFDEELSKLSTLEPAGAEFNVTRNYLDWLTQLPWGKVTEDSYDLDQAREVLEHDHYGMDDVKKRILEFIAVAQLKGSPSGKIICFVGPPGVGKTSIGKSIARALHREFFRFSVGGLTDVAEIKGHRRTYVGSMPGKLIQALKKVQSENPVIMIDEIDKLGRGHTGDPASALLELLDSEQNSSFLDHYLDVPVDLSKVLFICTGNVLDTIPGPLLDRMEVIHLSGYIAEEKREIAKQYLLPQALEQNGLKAEQLLISEPAIDALNRSYCRESGVRNLKNQIDKICRKAALQAVEKSAAEQITVDEQNLSQFLGPPPFTSEKLFTQSLLPSGVATGLAWTSLGGSILYFECLLERLSDTKSRHPQFTRTGQLGKIMEESSSIAYSFARSFLTTNHPHNLFFEASSIHMHVPEGATPKDGPSAGITMATALLSLALNKPLPSDLAMTGELSLTGKVMKIGGVREKIVAARRSGIKTVILPRANQAEWSELPSYLKENLTIVFADDYSDVAKLCGFY